MSSVAFRLEPSLLTCSERETWMRSDTLSTYAKLSVK
jgi:hypothetical protein